MRTAASAPKVCLAAVSAVAVLVAMGSSPPPSGKADAQAGPRGHRERFSKVGEAGDESAESQIGAEQFAQARTAPGVVLPGAYSAAFASLAALPVYGRSWSEVTSRPYDSDDPRYRDPSASNSGGGAGLVSGRITGLTAGGGAIYIGGAAGGVFRSTDGGATWTPLSDGLPTLSVGDLRLAPDGALWLATGEANTGATAYVGSGVYRLAKPKTGAFSAADRVGGSELESTLIGKVRFDGIGTAYAATSRGLWKHAAGTKSGAWRRVLYPVPDPVVGGVPRPDLQSAYNDICNDVAIDPRAGGQRVLANCAWRDGAAYNGFYLSTDGGETFARVNPGGALNPNDVGRATLAYASDGSRLYALVESMTHYSNSNQTALGGVFVSSSGDPSGPWNRIADSGQLGASGSALQGATFYHVGIQAWYNQFLDVDPADSDHVFVGLEEVFETEDGGTHWNAIGPYWNFDFPCWSFLDAQNNCPPSTHPDQHSVAIAGGKVYVGNDGGLYARPLRGHLNKNGNATDWVSLNANVRTLQYYSVAVGKVAGGVAVSGGLQDNGGSLLLPEDLSGNGQMGSPFGGDGGDTLVDPDDGCRILGEYVFLAMELTENCGRSDGTVRAVRDGRSARSLPALHRALRARRRQQGPLGGGRPIRVGQHARLRHPVGRGMGPRLQQRDGPLDHRRGQPERRDLVRLVRPLQSRRVRARDLDQRGWHVAAAHPARGAPQPVRGRAPRRSRRPLGTHRVRRVQRVLAALGGRAGSGTGPRLEDARRRSDLVRRERKPPGRPRQRRARELGAAGRGHGPRRRDLVGWRGDLVTPGANLPYTTAIDVHVGPDAKLYAATHGRGIWSIAQPDGRLCRARPPEAKLKQPTPARTASTGRDRRRARGPRGPDPGVVANLDPAPWDRRAPACTRSRKSPCRTRSRRWCRTFRSPGTGR
jgi:hypothetical protein